MWLKSIKFQVLAVLLIQLITLLGIVFSSLYLINLRQHDYLILNLAGQLRVITENLVAQSEHYLQQTSQDFTIPSRQQGLFNEDLKDQTKTFDKIIKSLEARAISADLVSPLAFSYTQARAASLPAISDTPETIHCKWDAPSRQQMTETAKTWGKFNAGLTSILGNGPDSPKLAAAAEYILVNQDMLTTSTQQLASTFRSMMEHKLSQIRLLNQSAIGIIILISLTIIAIIYRRIFRPVHHTVKGFHRIAHGDLEHRVPIYVNNEIGLMASAFNNLTNRLATLFRLTDRINQADNLDDTLKFVFEEFPVFLPLKWVAVLRTSRNNRDYHLDRCHGQEHFTISENELFPYPDSVFEKTVIKGTPICSSIEHAETPGLDDAFLQRLKSQGIESVFYLPLISNPLETAVLVLASDKPNAYNADHMEFLTNVAGQVRHGFEKTIGMESLVISTVKGLAKLAESRDPETGDHLFRMSHYSAIIAEELAGNVKYQGLIDANYVRDILKFSPMHDIGKVGISDSILLKPGKLTDSEFSTMQQHPTIGGDVLRRCEEQMNTVGRSVFRIGIEIAEGHHEKFDGNGYPNRLSGENIPLSARIVAVADVFDALTSKRPYKEAWPVDRAIELLESERGRHFDPEVVAAFRQALPKIMSIYEKHKHV